MNALSQVTYETCSDCRTQKTCTAQRCCRERGGYHRACNVIGCDERPAMWWHVHARAYYCRGHADRFNANSREKLCFFDSTGMYAGMVVQGQPAPPVAPPSDLQLAIARAIEFPMNGLRRPASDDEMERSRRVQWIKMLPAEQGRRLNQAAAVLAHLGFEAGGDSHQNPAAAAGWLTAIAAARAAVEAIPAGGEAETVRLGAEIVLKALFEAAGNVGLIFQQPSYLAPDESQAEMEV